MNRGGAVKHPVWGPLLQSIGHDRRLADGLAAFANYCAANGILPDQVGDDTVLWFQNWLERRTLYLRARDLVRRIPLVWNDAGRTSSIWPKTTLSRISFRPKAKRLRWEDLSESFRRDGEAYLALRGNPDIFDERPGAPKRPMAGSTLRLQRENIRLAASVLIEAGMAPDELASLADLVRPENFKTVLRHYHQKANGEANAFVATMARTLIQILSVLDRRDRQGNRRTQGRRCAASSSSLRPHPQKQTPPPAARIRASSGQTDVPARGAGGEGCEGPR